jgi:hypothetical protein
MLIGICGFKGSGKDTIANYLVRNKAFMKLSFASATKDVLHCIFGWNRQLLEGDTQKSREFRETVDEWWSNRLGIPNLTPRKMMQMIGTEIFRNHFHDEIWISIVEKQIIDNLNEYIVISDCRFPNEIEMIKRHGGILIHVYKDLPEWFYRYKKGEEVEEVKNIHPSETSWIKSNFDIEISNNGTIFQLECVLDDLLGNLILRKL